MRYINDSRTLPDDDSNKSVPQPPTISPNCEASVWLVNDVPRIAFTASKFFFNLLISDKLIDFW